jgi:hypothetical protein
MQKRLSSFHARHRFECASKGLSQMKAGGQWVWRKRLMRFSSRQGGNVLSPADFFATDSQMLKPIVKAMKTTMIAGSLYLSLPDWVSARERAITPVRSLSGSGRIHRPNSVRSSTRWPDFILGSVSQRRELHSLRRKYQFVGRTNLPIEFYSVRGKSLSKQRVSLSGFNPVFHSIHSRTKRTCLGRAWSINSWLPSLSQFFLAVK